MPKQPPSAVVRNAVNSPAAAAAALQPPRDRDCKAAVTQAPEPFDPRPTKWYTDGTEDHGQILNALGGHITAVAHYTNDLQMRIEQLRCEQENIKAKLDFLIRVTVR